MAGDALNSPGRRSSEAEGAFRPPPLLRNRHVQSILGNLPPQGWLIRRRAAALLAGSARLVLECGEDVRLQGFYSAAQYSRRQGDNRRLAVLLHGWEGSADSSYVLSCSALLYGRGHSVLRLNLRDHGATHALNRDLFHSCRLPEVVGAICAASARWPTARLCLGGFSLGGNFMLRVAADAGAPPTIAGVVAISPVIDPAATLLALERALPFYRRYFVRRWSRSLRIKQQVWPDSHDFEDLLPLKDLRQMTAALVQRCTDYGSLEAYLEDYALTGERLATLRASAAILVASDDPIIPAADLERLAMTPRLSILRTQYGGHCGFMDHWGQPSFADRYMLEQFERFWSAHPDTQPGT